MKLSEVIKAIEDGSKNKFTNKIYEVALKTYEHINGDNYVKFITNGDNSVLLDGWEEVKPPRQWSEKELMLFKLLPDWAKWIATDKGEDTNVFIYERKPKNINGTFNRSNPNEHDFEFLSMFDFLTITFEESPIYIGDLKGE